MATLNLLQYRGCNLTHAILVQLNVRYAVAVSFAPQADASAVIEAWNHAALALHCHDVQIVVVKAAPAGASGPAKQRPIIARVEPKQGENNANPTVLESWPREGDDAAAASLRTLVDNALATTVPVTGRPRVTLYKKADGSDCVEKITALSLNCSAALCDMWSAKLLFETFLQFLSNKDEAKKNPPTTFTLVGNWEMTLKEQLQASDEADPVDPPFLPMGDGRVLNMSDIVEGTPAPKLITKETQKCTLQLDLETNFVQRCFAKIMEDHPRDVNKDDTQEMQWIEEAMWMATWTRVMAEEYLFSTEFSQATKTKTRTTTKEESFVLPMATQLNLRPFLLKDKKEEGKEEETATTAPLQATSGLLMGRTLHASEFSPSDKDPVGAWIREETRRLYRELQERMARREHLRQAVALTLGPMSLGNTTAPVLEFLHQGSFHFPNLETETVATGYRFDACPLVSVIVARVGPTTTMTLSGPLESEDAKRLVDRFHAIWKEFAC